MPPESNADAAATLRWAAPGIAALWEADLSERLSSALEEPQPALAPLAAAVAAVVGVPMAARRYRPVRYALGAGALAAGLGGAWLVHALRDRLRFFEQSQRELSYSSRAE